MDSFNNIIVRRLIEVDSTISQRTIGSDGRLVSYGSLIKSGTPFANKYANIANIFEVVHKRRCNIPEAHPHDIQTRKISKFLKSGEQKFHFGKLKQAYQEVNKAFENLYRADT